ncbi:MAG: hypothetical protein Ta2G_01010 [Termitinemataceae bacterium]|nr:MAG: hypothetical protein Ta2G_01010 [Termitinemataceae bacterium]
MKRLVATVEIDNSSTVAKTRTFITQSNIASRINITTAVNENNSSENIKPIFDKPQELEYAKTVLQIITENEKLPSSDFLTQDKVIESFIVEADARQEAEEILSAGSKELDGLKEKVNKKEIVETVVKEFIKNTIDIPKILIYPKNKNGICFDNFTLDCSEINFKPVEKDLLIQKLRTGEQNIVSFSKENDKHIQPENILIYRMSEFDDISYEEYSELLYKLCKEAVSHIETYLNDKEDVNNVIQYYQTNIANIIHIQLLMRQKENDLEYDVKITKGWTELKPLTYSTSEDAEKLNFKQTDYERSKIGKIIFNGFEKCLYPAIKFSSDTERKFSIILDRDSIKWLRPALGQFEISYCVDNNVFEYVPDFVAETDDSIYMIETKAANEISSPAVLAKKAAALKWCGLATEYNKTIAKKPWKYLLIPHDEVHENRDLHSFE